MNVFSFHLLYKVSFSCSKWYPFSFPSFVCRECEAPNPEGHFRTFSFEQCLCIVSMDSDPKLCTTQCTVPSLSCAQCARCRSRCALSHTLLRAIVHTERSMSRARGALSQHARPPQHQALLRHEISYRNILS